MYLESSQSDTEESFVENASESFEPWCFRSFSVSQAVAGDQCEYNSWTLVARFLYWVKFVTFRAIKTYRAFPVLLFMLPLAFGFVAGIAFSGRRVFRRQYQKSKRSNSLDVSLARITSLMALLFGRNVWVEEVDECLIPADSNNAINELVPSSIGRRERLNDKRDEETRKQLLHGQENTERESGIPVHAIPRHIAIIMDGNRRYGREVYGSEYKGHWEGCRKLLEMCIWCLAENVGVLTVFAFSTENWNRKPTEVSALMEIVQRYCDELQTEAVKRRIRVRIISTDSSQVPPDVAKALQQLEEATAFKTTCCELELNICMSYGSRGEITDACRNLARNCAEGQLDPSSITEEMVGKSLLIHDTDPDVLIRTSGELRVSNFLLWQLAYAELFFVQKRWPEINKEDFLQVLQENAKRHRRFGK